MDTILLTHPFSWFILGIYFFYLAVQRPPCLRRWILSFFHASSMTICLHRADHIPILYRRLWTEFVVGSTINASSALLVEKQVIHLGSSFFIQRIRVVLRTWSNMRRLPLLDDATSTALQNSANDGAARLTFALLKSGRVLVLWLMQRIAIGYISHTFLFNLNISHQDFASTKQVIWPLMTRKDLYLRTFFSLNWIWDTYAILTISHDLLAIFFVCVLRWDMPQEWPPLFGNITEAHSLRRFWGVFWHRLHVAPFTILMPTYLNSHHIQHILHGNLHLKGSRVAVIMKALKALWIFLLSGICHVAANFAMMRKGNTREEIRFFLSNYMLCFMETIVERTVRGKSRQPTISSIWIRLLGYGWIFAVFFCLVPAWQYSLIYIALDSHAGVPG